MAIYQIYNGPSPTTASQAAVTTGTAIKTLLQVKPGTTRGLYVVEWGISFDGFAAAAPGIVELTVTDTAATVTAHVAAGIVMFNAEAMAEGDQTTAKFAVGTTSTGYTASAEGTVGTNRCYDVQHIAPTNQYIKQFPLGARPYVKLSEFLRIRVKFAAAINAICYVTVEA